MSLNNFMHANRYLAPLRIGLGDSDNAGDVGGVGTASSSEFSVGSGNAESSSTSESLSASISLSSNNSATWFTVYCAISYVALV